MFKLIQLAPMSSNNMTPYLIQMNKKVTVRDFIQEAMRAYPENEGMFTLCYDKGLKLGVKGFKYKENALMKEPTFEEYEGLVTLAICKKRENVCHYLLSVEIHQEKK